MKKSIVIMTLAFLVITVCSTAFAWHAPRMDGRPEAFDPGSSTGYFIWRDDRGLHLWTTTDGSLHEFTGVIRTDGKFVDVHGRHLESSDWINVGPSRHSVHFDFSTAGGEDGMNFNMEDGDHVTFELFVDGHRVNPENIYIGRRGWHPEHHDFTLLP